MTITGSTSESQRIVSGMRASGKLHLGHFQGVLKNWVKLQYEYDCYFFVADWHGLTTNYEDPFQIEKDTWDMIVDWLACGVNPGSCKIYIQSRVPEQAELHLLLSMITPLGWLERVPTYKDQQEKLKEKDLATYGFLGYPLLQSADILAYKGNLVPVGEDQISHLELVREVARRFNHLYGKEPGYEDKIEAAILKLGKKQAKSYQLSFKAYQETGDEERLAQGQAIVSANGNLSLGDRERLLGHLEGGGRIILPEPHHILSDCPKVPGLDGQKMSKSYNNTIGLREPPKEIEQKIRVMPTDPARIRRQDPGDPEKCPVWGLHKLYSTEDVKSWVVEGCTTAGIGCIECKKALSDAIIEAQAPILEKAAEYEGNMSLVKEIVRDGCEKARDEAKETLEEVRDAMGFSQRDR